MSHRVRALAVIGLIGLGGFGVADRAAAGVVLYSSGSSFQAATTGLTTIDFEDHASSSLTSYSTAAGLSVGPVNFKGVTDGGGNWLYVVRPAYYGYYNIWPAGSSPTVLQGPSGGGSVANGHLDVTLSGNYSAVGSGLYVLRNGGSGGPAGQIKALVTDLSGTYEFTINTTAAPDIAFGGFVSDSKITSIRYTAVGLSIFPNLSNFRYGAAADATAVPEPSSLMLGSLGILACFGGRWVRRTRAASA